MRVLFDNTFGPPMTEWLAKTVQQWHKGPPVQLLHKRARFPGDTPDDIWIPQLEGEDWIVVSSDMSRHGHPKLNQVCRDCKKSLFEFSGALSSAGTFEWIRALMHLWPIMLVTADGCRNEWHHVAYGDSHRRTFKNEIKPWPTGILRKSAGRKKKS